VATPARNAPWLFLQSASKLVLPLPSVIPSA
jgi:hypothetical protein